MDTIGGIALADDQLARRAIAALQGYSYQLYATALAWVSLKTNETLLVEVAEDYAVVARGALALVQAKNEEGRTVTLRHPGVVKMLNGWWSMRTVNPDLRVTTCYLSTGRAGREVGLSFPSRLKGLDYWRSAAAGDDPEPIRQALQQLDLAPAFGAWLREASDDVLRRDLLCSVTWSLGGDTLEERRHQLAGRIRQRPGLHLMQNEAQRVVDAIVVRLLEVASRHEASPLSSANLDELIEATASITLSTDQFRRVASGALESFSPPLFLPGQDDASGRLFYFAAQDRVPLIGRANEMSALSAWTRADDRFSWTLLTGPGGGGKSRLGLELCLQAQMDGWSAGFLPMASSFSKPDNFTRFNPAQPTLMVIDYAGENPDAVGQIVRTLCERAAARDLNTTIRLLLLDRNGHEGPWWLRFCDGHERFMQQYRGTLGSNYLKLPPLAGQDVVAIVRHLACENSDRAETISKAVEGLDPLKRPLFAALAGDALRAGRDLRSLDRNGLLHDILARERRHWRTLARSDEEQRQHVAACVLATMTGSLDLPQDGLDLASPLMPFHEGAYNDQLIAAITGRSDAFRITPLEPDIVGEWLALEMLRPRTPFDSAPAELLRLAADRNQRFQKSADHFAAFCARAIEDFPNEVMETSLTTPPPPTAPEHVQRAFITILQRGFPHILASHPAQSRALFDALAPILEHHPSSEVAGDLAQARTIYVAYLPAAALSQAVGIFDERCEAWRQRTGDWVEGRQLAYMGEVIIDRHLAIDDPKAAQAVFDRLLTMLQLFRGGEEFEEVAAAVASAGLYLRDWLESEGDQGDVDRLDQLLWASPRDEMGIDLAAACGEAMLERSTVIDEHSGYLELKKRVRERPEVAGNIFFAACLGVGSLKPMPSETHLAFFDRIKDVVDWVETHRAAPDMGEAVDYLFEDGIISDDAPDAFVLGPVPATALFNAWRESLRDGWMGHNATLALQTELEEVLAANDYEDWADAMRTRMADLLAKSKVRH